jgi:hypothetical protein
MNTDTSDDFDISYLNNNNDNNNNMEKTNANQKKTNFTTDTDFHLNYLANPDKVKLNLDDTIPKLSDQDDDSDSNVSKLLDNINSKNSSDTSIIIDDDSQSMDNYDNDNSSSSKKVNILKKTTQSSDKRHSEKSPFTTENKVFSEKELRFKKIELLRKLSEIKASGYELSKDYDFNSDIEEMEYEYELLKSMKDKQNGVGLYKSFLLNAVTAVEFLNDRYDPFDFKLSGWSEHMNIAADDYGDVLGEVYEKYRGSGKKMEPEIKLMLMICASGASFHASNTMFKQLPGLEKIIKDNPALLSKLTSQMFTDKEKESQFMTRQEVNAQEQQKQLMIRQQELKTEQMRKQNELRQQQLLRQQMLERQRQNEVLSAQGFHNAPAPAPIMQMNPNVQHGMINNQVTPQQINQMEHQRQQQINTMNDQVTGPSNVDNIINKITQERLNEKKKLESNNIMISDETSSNERVVSSSTLQNDSSGNPVSKRGRKKKKKSTISINTNS